MPTTIVTRTPAAAAAAAWPAHASGASDFDDPEGARAALHALLARLLLEPPDASLLRALAARAQGGPASGWLPSPLEQALFDLHEAAAAMPPELVALEHAALFEAVGVPLVDPYASRYLAGTLMERPLAELREQLAALGLARLRAARVTEDHLGALCEAMRLLIERGAPLATQRAFFAERIEPWAGRCLADIEGAVPANFYRCVARLARAFFEVEHAAFELDEEPA